VGHQLVALGARVAAEHVQAALERNQPQDRLERGGLAGAVGPDQADDAPGRDGERGRIQRHLVLVGLAQAAGGDDGLAVAVVGAVHLALHLLSGSSSSAGDRPNRAMRSSTAGHSSRRKRSRSLASSFRLASSVTYIPSPLRFSTSASSASSWYA